MNALALTFSGRLATPAAVDTGSDPLLYNEPPQNAPLLEQRVRVHWPIENHAYCGTVKYLYKYVSKCNADQERTRVSASFLPPVG